MFKFFKKSNQETKEKPIAYLSLSVNKNDTIPRLNVKIEDYSDDSIIALCQILETFNSKEMQEEAYTIIKNFFMQDEETEAMIKFVETMQQIQQINVETQESQPYIKPSELM